LDPLISKQDFLVVKKVAMGFTGKDGIIIWTAILVRVVLLAFGTYQDAHFELKYTDIDYEVYTDAAYFMWRGESPYKRSTYRYTPLLAALLTPNVYLHPLFGKVAFCCADIVAALLMKRLLGRRGYLGEGNRRWVSDIGVAIWLFSPFTAPISTRGNGESLVTLMLIGMLDLMETQNLMIAGLLYGLAVHWRLYPVIYSIPLCLHLLLRASLQKIPRQHSHGSVAQNDRVDGLKYSKLRFTYFDYRSTLWFFLPAGLVFVVLGGFFYLMYGDQFLQETYLYHATRTDPRHNFSPYFYPAYLTSQLCRLEYVQDGSR
jgi:phosphatidylinositol glycan class M